MANKVLFLDIDGPVIPQRMYALDGGSPIPDPVFIDFMNQQLHKCEHDVKIVIISVWRKYYEFELRNNVLLEISDYFHDDWKTKDLWHGDYGHKERPVEVQEWLQRHPEVDDFLIIDDEYYGEFDFWKNNSINVDGRNGISFLQFQQIRKFLHK